MNINELKGSYNYAMHGNGAFKGLRQTNTMEAFSYWHGKGIKIFEIDFARTADGNYVAVAHTVEDKSLRRLEIIDLPPVEQRTEEWFMSQKLFSISTKGLTPLSLKTCVETARANKDCIFVFDLFGFFTKDECFDFAQKMKGFAGDDNELWNRILLEAYNGEMSEGLASGAPEGNIIYCARYEYNDKEDGFVSPDWLLERNIRFVSYPWKYENMFKGEIEKYSSAGITVFSRTKFNTKNGKLKAAGVSVNLIAKRFDGILIIFQYPLYMLTYFKRIYVKKLVQKKTRGN